MSDPLRVLMLEDTLTDAELEERELRKIGIPYTLMRVETQDAFVNALEEFRPDVILSDYNLPEFSGLAALAIVRRDHPEVPMIMVTGALTDIEAVELIHAGAKDYVLKDRLARLGAAVQRALSMEQGIRARKAAERALHDSHDLLVSVLENAPVRVFWKDSESRYMGCNSAFAHDAGMSKPEQLIGKDDFQMGWREQAELYRADDKRVMESGLPKLGFEEPQTAPDGRTIWLRTSKVPLRGADEKVFGMLGIYEDITERKLAEEERRINAQKLEKVLEQTIDAVAAMVEARDPYTAGHQRRVATIACAIGKAMGLPADNIRSLHMAATIHDLGKIHIPAEILSKPGRLNTIEFELIKTHSQAGYEIIKDVQFPWPIAQIVLQHHERLDGSGYPQGLKGDQILAEAKILAVADVVEAMVSHRPYRAGLGEEAALAEISNHRGVLYDSAVVDSCIALFREKKFEFETDSPRS